jgi:EAL domain-containing protein (putative c-di-GMP-specific phosphodiesterase class I)
MSLAPLVAHFNQQFQQAAWAGARAPFALEEGAVVAGFYGMRLESVFDALLDAGDEVLGYQAWLHAFSPRGNSVSPRAPYAVALDEDSIVYLDRLVRTLHVLNAAAWGLSQGNRIKSCHYLSIIDPIYWHFFKD